MPPSLEAMLQKVAATPSKNVSTTAARRLVMDTNASALALLIAAKALAGEAWHEWEPETLWLTLHAKGIDVPDANRDKIMAGWTLGFVPSFYWDGFVFEKTALAFDGHAINPERLEEANVAQLAWATQEAAHIRQHFEEPTLEYEHEPKAYAGVVLHREGFLLAPEQLRFAQEQLDKNNPGMEELRSQVQSMWTALDKKSLSHHVFEESPLDVQLARLAAVELHVQERERQTAEELRALYDATP